MTSAAEVKAGLSEGSAAVYGNITSVMQMLDPEMYENYVNTGYDVNTRVTLMANAFSSRANDKFYNLEDDIMYNEMHRGSLDAEANKLQLGEHEKGFLGIGAKDVDGINDINKQIEDIRAVYPENDYPDVNSVPGLAELQSQLEQLQSQQDSLNADISQLDTKNKEMTYERDKQQCYRDYFNAYANGDTETLDKLGPDFANYMSKDLESMYPPDSPEYSQVMAMAGRLRQYASPDAIPEVDTSKLQNQNETEAETTTEEAEVDTSQDPKAESTEQTETLEVETNPAESNEPKELSVGEKLNVVRDYESREGELSDEEKAEMAQYKQDVVDYYNEHNFSVNSRYDSERAEAVNKWKDELNPKEGTVEASEATSSAPEIPDPYARPEGMSDEDYKKHVDEVNREAADRVWRGDFGNGEDRRAALEAAGFRYEDVQGMVNADIQAMREAEEAQKVQVAEVPAPKSEPAPVQTPPSGELPPPPVGEVPPPPVGEVPPPANDLGVLPRNLGYDSNAENKSTQFTAGGTLERNGTAKSVAEIESKEETKESTKEESKESTKDGKDGKDGKNDTSRYDKADTLGNFDYAGAWDKTHSSVVDWDKQPGGDNYG